MIFLKKNFPFPSQLAQPIRLLLEYTGTEYEEKIYDCGPAPDYDKSCWFDVKFTLGLDFPNVCVYLLNTCGNGVNVLYVL